MSANGVECVVDRHPALMESLCRALQGIEKIEDLDQKNQALISLKRAILLTIAAEITEEDELNTA